MLCPKPLTSILSPSRRGEAERKSLMDFHVRGALDRSTRLNHLSPRFAFLAGYSARTVSAIPPRAENCAVTIASRGAHALIRSSKIRFVTASLNARSLRYDAR